MNSTKHLKLSISLLLTSAFVSGFSQVSTKEKNGKWALVEKKKEITTYKFDEILNSYSDYFIARQNDQWGVLNKKGTAIVPFEYAAIKDDMMGFLIVERENKYGVIDTFNQILVNLAYDEIDHFSSDSIALVRKADIWTYVKENKKVDKDFIVFLNPDQIALFKVCQFCKKEESKQYATQQLLDYVYRNLKYPKEAYEKRITGTIVIAFWVTSDGEVINPRILREIGGNCGTVGLDLIKNMPRWEKGAIKKGALVNSEFILPIKFTLN